VTAALVTSTECSQSKVTQWKIKREFQTTIQRNTLTPSSADKVDGELRLVTLEIMKKNCGKVSKYLTMMNSAKRFIIS
jgi:hypothetical protein